METIIFNVGMIGMLVLCNAMVAWLCWKMWKINDWGALVAVGTMGLCLILVDYIVIVMILYT